MVETSHPIQPLTWSYPVLHWILTIITAPILTVLYGFFNGEWNSVVDVLNMYSLMLIFGGAMSVPVACVYFIVAYFVIGDKVSKAVAKALLISISCLGVILTFMYLGIGVSDLAIAVPYLIANLLLGIVLQR